MSEKIQIDYSPRYTGREVDSNILGANINQTLRSVPSYTLETDAVGVRKYGNDLAITACTDIDAPSANLIVKVYSRSTDTLLGSRANGGAFSAGSSLASAEGVYIVFEASGNATIDTSLSITLAGRGAFTANFSAEIMTNGETFTFYLADSGSSYYDTLMRYGGERHTPDKADEYLPYFDIDTAYGQLDGATWLYVAVLDSATYDEEITADTADTFVFAVLGQTPTITRGIGARITRTVSQQYNNITAKYWNESGNDSTGVGTWHNPYKTLAQATTDSTTEHQIYGGTNASGLGEDTSQSGGLATLKIEADAGFAPTYRNISLSAGNSLLYGFNVDCKNVGVGGIGSAGGTGKSYDCTVLNQKQQVGAFTYGGGGFVSITEMHRCISDSCYQGYLGLNDTTIIIDKCIFKNCTNFGFGFNATLVIMASNITITNCIVYGSGADGIYFFNDTLNWSGDTILTNNLLFDNAGDGINYVGGAGAEAGSHDVDKNILFDNGGWGISAAGGFSVNADYNAFEDNDDGTTTGLASSTNEVTADLNLIRTDSTPYYLAIGNDSACYKADGADEDIGPHIVNIDTAANAVEINGFILDGQSRYDHAIWKTGANDFEDMVVKWCIIKNYQGIALDDWSNDTGAYNTDSNIANNLFTANGNGARFQVGGNTIQNNAFYRNIKTGVYCDYTNTINHNVFYNNQYGLRTTTNAVGMVCKNNIFQQNTVYGIFADVYIKPIYTCMLDAFNSNVDFTDATNTTDDPLFINVLDGTEDFHIMTKDRDFTIDSVCKETGESGSDIGAYTVTRSVGEESWKKYVLSHNPRNINEALSLKGKVNFANIFGDISGYYRSNRIILPFSWASNSATDKEQRLKIRHLQTLVPSLENELKEADCDFRIHLLPTAYYGTGAAGTVDASAKTLTDATKSWVENEKKGWWISIKYLSGTGNIDGSAKTLTDTGAFTGEDYTGYYVKWNGLYYIIKSNTDNVLTLSDENDQLVTVADYDYDIVKFFKIASNDETALTLVDDNAYLIDGVYGYFIDFIKCRVRAADFSYRQPVLKYDDDVSKSGYKILFEEVE